MRMKNARRGVSPLGRAMTVALTGCVLAAPGGPRVAHADDPALPEILRQLREWRESFATIRVEWRYQDRFDPADPNIEGDHYAQSEFLWADWGGLRWETAIHQGGRKVYRTLLGTDGIQPWEARTNHDEADRLATIQLPPPRPDKPLSFNINFPAVQGLWGSQEAMWIDEYLAGAGDLALSGYEDLGGHRCAVVRLRRELETLQKPASGVPFREETFWLDAERDFLPRQVRVDGSVAGPTGVLEGLQPWSTWTVTEFGTFDDRWFPTRGHLLLRGEEPPGMSWVMNAVAFNESLPKSRFGVPKPDPGTNVIDYARQRGHQVAGGRPSASAKADAAGGPPRDAGGVRAVATSFPWPWAGFAAATLVAVGLILTWRRRGRRET